MNNAAFKNLLFYYIQQHFASVTLGEKRSWGGRVATAAAGCSTATITHRAVTPLVYRRSPTRLCSVAQLPRSPPSPHALFFVFTRHSSPSPCFICRADCLCHLPPPTTASASYALGLDRAPHPRLPPPPQIANSKPRSPYYNPRPHPARSPCALAMHQLSTPSSRYHNPRRAPARLLPAVIPRRHRSPTSRAQRPH